MIAWQSAAHERINVPDGRRQKKKLEGKKQVIAWQSAANEKKEYTGGAETAEERMK